MKDYIVHNTCGLLQYNEWFLVKANTKKEALSKVYKQHGEEFNKKDFECYTLEEFYKLENNDGVSVIH